MRERITITISKFLLNALDSKIDGINLRSRSQAIEYFLSKVLEAESKTNCCLIILPQIKLKNKSFEFFKVPKLKKTILELYLENLQRSFPKLGEIFILAKRRSKKLENIAKKFNAKILTKNENELKKILTKNESLTICFANKFCRLSFEKLVAFQKTNKENASIVIAVMPKQKGISKLILDGNKIVSIEKKPKEKFYAAPLGIYAVNTKNLKLKDLCSEENKFLEKLVKNNSCLGFFYNGDYAIVNKLKDISSLKNFI